MNIGEVVNEVGTQAVYGLPWLTIGGVIVWLIQRFFFNRQSVGAGSSFLDNLRTLRELVVSVLAVVRWIPGDQPDQLLQKLLNILDSVLGIPGIESQPPEKVKELMAETANKGA